jgi:hypothetical protein
MDMGIIFAVIIVAVIIIALAFLIASGRLKMGGGGKPNVSKTPKTTKTAEAEQPKANFCPKCANTLGPKDKFCHKCGVEV